MSNLLNSPYRILISVQAFHAQGSVVRGRQHAAVDLQFHGSHYRWSERERCGVSTGEQSCSDRNFSGVFPSGYLGPSIRQ